MNLKITLRPVDQPYEATPEEVAAYRARTTDEERMIDFLNNMQLWAAFAGKDWINQPLGKVLKLVPANNYTDVHS